MLRSFVACFIAVASLLCAPRAFAQASDPDALFQRGLAAMRARDYATGCPLVEQSYRLDPVPGALFTLAECEAAWGKLSASLDHYRAFLGMVTSMRPERREAFEERRRIATEKMAAMSAVMPEVTIEIAPGAPATLVVKRNGEVVAPSAYGVVQKVDPGEYAITAEAPGGATWERRVALGKSDRARVIVPWPLPGDAPAPPSQAPPSPPESESSSTSPARTWAYVTGGVGVAALATGAVAGLIAMGQKSAIDTNCVNHLCNAAGQSAVSTGQTAATISTIAIPVGLVATSVAAVLFFKSSDTSDSPRAARSVRATVSTTAGGAMLGVQGAW